MPTLGTHVYRRWLPDDRDWEWASYPVLGTSRAYVYVEILGNRRRLRRADLESRGYAVLEGQTYYTEPGGDGPKEIEPLRTLVLSENVLRLIMARSRTLGATAEHYILDLIGKELGADPERWLPKAPPSPGPRRSVWERLKKPEV